MRLAYALPEERLETFLELGNISHRGGKSVDALEAFEAAAGVAREIGAVEGLARAAIGYETACWRPGIVDEGAIELLEEAAASLGAEDSELRVGLLGGLARALDFQGRRRHAAAVRTTAVEIARRLGDSRGLAGVLVSSYWSRGTTPLPDILDMLTEARDIGTELGDTEIRADAMSWRVPAFVALCDHVSARAEAAALLEIAEQTAQPFIVHVAEHYGAAIALCDGSLQESEARARRSHEWSRLLTGRDASGVFGIQMFSVLREQGRLAEMAPVVRLLARDASGQVSWRPGLVALLAELGMREQAEKSWRGSSATGSIRFANRCGWAHWRTWPTRPLRLGRGCRGPGLPRAGTVRWWQRHDRSPGRVLRRGRPVPRDAGDHAR